MFHLTTVPGMGATNLQEAVEELFAEIVDLGDDGGAITIIGRSTDIVINNETSPQNITGFIVPLSASATEIVNFDLDLIFDGNTAADIKLSTAGPAGYAGYWGPIPGSATSSGWGFVGTGSTPVGLTTIAVDLTMGTGTNPHGVLVKGSIRGGGTAGNVQFRFAQNAAHASNLTLHRGSELRYRTVSP